MVDNAMASSPTRSSALAMRERVSRRKPEKSDTRPAAHTHHILHRQRKLRLQSVTLCQPANHRAFLLPAKTAAHRRNKPGERFEQRGFSTSVGPDNGGHTSALNYARQGTRNGHAVVTRNQFIHDNHGNATAQRTASPINTIITSASRNPNCRRQRERTLTC